MQHEVNRRMRGAVAAGAILAALVGGGVATASAASAAELDGTLNSGEFGLYYLAGQSSSVFDSRLGDQDLSNNNFPNTGTHANDNTRSYRNRDTRTWWVYTAANGGGSEYGIGPGSVNNFNTTFSDKVSSLFPYRVL
jgi:hypothetical protein